MHVALNTETNILCAWNARVRTSTYIYIYVAVPHLFPLEIPLAQTPLEMAARARSVSLGRFSDKVPRQLVGVVFGNVDLKQNMIVIH
mgnify:CR=1 FL=1